jgi:hypothetical protein
VKQQWQYESARVDCFVFLEVDRGDQRYGENASLVQQLRPSATKKTCLMWLSHRVFPGGNMDIIGHIFRFLALLYRPKVVSHYCTWQLRS